MQIDKKKEPENNNDDGSMYEDISLIVKELLLQRPLFGELSIKFYFRNGHLCRITTSKEESTLMETNLSVA